MPITKSANASLFNTQRDEAIERLGKPEVTKPRGIGAGSVLGGLLGTGAALATRRPSFGKGMLGGAIGSGTGALLGYLTSKEDQEGRAESKDFLRQYNRYKLREIMRNRYLARQQAMGRYHYAQ